MNKKQKTAAGVSGASIILLVFRLFHAYHSFTSSPNEPSKFTVLPATIIFKDSSGKTDTMLLEDYMKQHH